MRGDPSLATAVRYFTGTEQDRLERQMTSYTDAYERTRIQRAKRGLAELRKFDSKQMTKTERVSKKVMESQLRQIVTEEPDLDYTFPLQQYGASINLFTQVTLGHPVQTERDAGTMKRSFPLLWIAGHRIWRADKRKSLETQPVSGSLFGLRLDVGWIEIGNFADLMRQ